MSTKAIEIVLSTDQLQRLNALATVEGVTIADIVRRALNAYLESQSRLALAATFGADRTLVPPSRGVHEWIDDIGALPPLDIEELTIQEAVSDSKEDFGDDA